jgi:cytochrome P450
VQPTADAVRSLVQVEAAFMESTRLWPPVPADIKECVKDCTFPCGTTIPRGTSMIYTPFLLNRLPRTPTQ